MGRAGYRDMILWERSYWFSTPGKFFACLYFLLELKEIVWQHTIKSPPQLLITPTPQVNQELPCRNNYEEEEGGKSGQGKYLAEDFCHSVGRRNQWED